MNQNSTIIAALIDGEPRQQISLLDRGLAYGDGVFETIKVDTGKLALWQLHKQRLFVGCRALGIPFTDQAILDKEATELASRTNQPAVLKLVITRGQGGRGYRADERMTPNRMLWITERQDAPIQYQQQGVDVTVCHHRLPHSPNLAGIKHLNRLDQVIARREWQEEYQEGLLCDEQGNVIEGTMSNLFVYHGRKLLTPNLDRCGVAGVMRAHIMQQAEKQGIVVSEQSITIKTITHSDGAFLCNSLIGLWPIKKIDQQIISISEFSAEILRMIKT